MIFAKNVTKKEEIIKIPMSGTTKPIGFSKPDRLLIASRFIGTFPGYITPKSSMAPATFKKPAMLAPLT